MHAALASKFFQLPLVTGPYGYLFASFVPYYSDYPSTAYFGWKFSNKV